MPGREKWRRQMSLGQGHGLGELAGRLLSTSRAGACCAQSAGEVVVLLAELLQRNHHTAESALRLWRHRLLPEIGWKGQPASEVLQVLVIPCHRAHHLSQMSYSLHE